MRPVADAATYRPPTPEPLREWRCACGALLARVKLAPGAAVEVRCHKCKRVTVREAA